MKEIGVITLLSVAATAAAPTYLQPAPAPVVTAKSTANFTRCLTGIEKRRRADLFVQNQAGGRVQKFAERSARALSVILISDRGSRRMTQFENPGPNSPEAEGVNQCI